MKIIRYAIIALVVIVVGPISWVAAWNAGSWFTFLLSLAIPSYGIIYASLLELIGRVFLVHSMLSLALGIAGAYLSLMIIAVLTERQSPSSNDKQ